MTIKQDDIFSLFDIEVETNKMDIKTVVSEKKDTAISLNNNPTKGSTAATSKKEYKERRV